MYRDFLLIRTILKIAPTMLTLLVCGGCFNATMTWDGSGLGDSTHPNDSETLTAPTLYSLSQSLVTVTASSLTSGLTDLVTLTVKDTGGITLSGGGYTVAFTTSGGSSSGTFSAVVDHADGTYTATFTAIGAGAATTIRATINGTAVSSTAPSVTVNSGSVVSLGLSGYPASIVAGTLGTLIVKARDLNGNTVPGYTGTVHLSSNDGGATLPGNYTFVVGDSGSKSFSVTLITANPAASISAADTVTAGINGIQSAINVNPGAATLLTVLGFPSPRTAGVAANLTVTALDNYGNTATGYTGTAHFTSNDGQATLPGDSTFQTADQGTKSFPITLKTSGAHSITVTDTVTGSIFGAQGSISILPAAAVGLAAVGFATTQTAGTPDILTFVAKDPFSNPVPSYTGTVHFTSSDASAALPADYTYVAGDNGSKSFSVTLKTAGTSRTVTATDTVTGSVTGSRSGVTVVPGAASLALSTISVASGSVVSGTGDPVTLMVRDSSGNQLAIGGLSIAFSNSGGTSTGVFGSVTDGGNGTYISTFTGGSPGTATTIHATIAAASVSSAAPTITVTAAPPAGLAYAFNPAVYIKGLSIPSNSPTSIGGAITSYSVSPTLPAGVTLSTSTGIITGAFSALQAATNYTVTASNSGGSTTAVVSFLVKNAPLTGQSTMIAAGSAHTCAIVNGGAQCWGLNGNGQLGINSMVDSHVMAQVSGLTSGVRAIAASGSGYHTCAVVNGGAQCWGINGNGQLGNNSTTQSLVPVSVSGLSSGVQAVSAGSNFSCALVNGGVWCWGYNFYGQLGNNTTAQSSAPVQVSGLSSGVQAIAVGDEHACALVDGGVKCWGHNNVGQLGDNTFVDRLVPTGVSGLSAGSAVQALVTGGFHSCALIDGGVKCWGYNSTGQLGNNSTVNSSVPVQGLSGGTQAIAAGGNQTCAIVNGNASCWGLNSSGQLGINSTVDSHFSVQVSSLGTGVQGIAVGGAHSCGVVNGAVQCWGSDASGQLGNNSISQSLVPVNVQGLDNGNMGVFAGYGFSCGILNGAATCWGDNLNGELGNGTVISSSIPVQVSGLTAGVQAISPGNLHACALANGGVKCWGDNTFGQLGDGTFNASQVPVAVSGLTSGVQAVAVGLRHTCALTNGSVKCWGSNVSGHLGNNTTVGSNVPVQVQGLTTAVQAIAVGFEHSCALVSGAVYCWGLNTNGQVGNSTFTDSLIPVAVSTLGSSVQAIAAGEYHSCAIVSGSAKCWGMNNGGRLGNNSTTDSSVPVQVSGLLGGVQLVSGGGSHTCAIVNGGAQCWGDNFYSQLGTGNTTTSFVPVAVSGLSTGVQSISGGGYHSCAMSSGAVKCWGQNTSGQLGNNSNANSAVPVLVGL